MGFCASVTVSASVSVASVNQALGIHPGGMGYSLYSDDRDDRRIFYGLQSAIWYFKGSFKQNPLKR